MTSRRRTPYTAALYIASLFLVSAAQDPYDCSKLKLDSLNYDLSPLAGVRTVSRTRDTPPSTMIDELGFDVCAELSPLDGVAEQDQCPSGTRACLRKINRKGEGDSDRVVAVIPVAQSSSLSPSYSALTSSKGLSITLHGSSYPANANPISQSFKLSLICAESASDPKFTSYENGQVSVEWSAPAACGSSSDDKEKTPPPPKEDDKKTGGDNDSAKENVGNGMGWFFLVLFLAFATYMGLGAYYNYSNYGARGIDLIPHRDFWREVPYMLRDVASHLCSTVRPRRSSRGGYIAV
ncbi:autophagy-related protein 27 [Hygrophoropsis aurantiaca]|uniref:Autophagy-related protein 27 n=1 Tax=Hygrophoropsis aurantiaca TaxID=72124 RepID=A0ACB8AN09_9AGAM|nr:autophagy-related protein 27 [Hygrophoropsis aurantiaca]